MVEGKKDEGATRRVRGAWTLGAAWARHLAGLATARRNILDDWLYGRIVWQCLVQRCWKSSLTIRKLLPRERAFQSRRSVSKPWRVKR